MYKVNKTATAADDYDDDEDLDGPDPDADEQENIDDGLYLEPLWLIIHRSSSRCWRWLRRRRNRDQASKYILRSWTDSF